MIAPLTHRPIRSVLTSAVLALAAPTAFFAPAAHGALWQSNSGGLWSASNNWAGSVPTAVPDVATFQTPPGGVVVSLNMNPSLDILSFPTGTGYRIQGSSATSTISLGGTSQRALLNGSGVNAIDAHILLAKDIDAEVLFGGTLTVERDISGPTRAVRKLGGGTLVAQELQLKDLNIIQGTIRFRPIVSSQPFSRTETLTISNGVLDVFNQPLLVDYTGVSPANTINGYIYAASPRITSTSTGINSTQRIAMGVGYYDTAWSQSIYYPGAPYMGNAVDFSTVIVRDTLIGDANLDLRVDFGDLLTLAQNAGIVGTHWYQGNFDGDASNDFDDLLALAQNYGRDYLRPELTNSLDFEADWALARSMVPEPGMMTMTAALCATSTARRRRQ